MVTIYTLPMALRHQAIRQAIDVIDITWKTGIPIFAPEKAAYFALRHGELSEPMYAHYYRLKMRWSYREHQSAWLGLAVHSQIGLACYCPTGQFCHRHLFREMLTSVLTKHAIAFTDKGELEKEMTKK